MQRASARMWMAVAVVAGAVAGVACTQKTFACMTDPDCVSSGPDGTCEPTGFCSFPDPACPSERRYGDLAGDGLAGMCVPQTEGSTGPGSTSAGSDSTSTSTSTSTSSTTDPQTTTTSTSTTGDSTSSTGGSSSTDPLPDDPYGPCQSEGDCPVQGSMCIGDQMGQVSVCAPPCMTSDDCPTARSGTDADCGILRLNVCFLPCGDGLGQCPDGMICARTGLNETVCVWE